MNRQVRKAAAQRAHQLRRRLGLEQPCHVLDGQEVNVARHQLLRKVEVVVDGVLGLVGVGQVAGVADGGLHHAPGLMHRLDTELEILHVVQRVKHTEDVDAAVLSLLDKLLDDVVRVGGVAHGVGAAQQHLEGHVGHLGAQLVQALPGALVQEAHAHVKGGPAPHLHGEGVVEGVRGVVRDGVHVHRAHARGQQALVCVTPGGVRQQQALVRAHRPRKPARALLQQHLPPAGELLRGFGRGGHARHHAQRRLAHRAWVVGAVHHHLRQEGEQARRAVARLGEDKQALLLVHVVGVDGGVEELGAAQHVLQKRDVGLDAAHAELAQAAVQLLHCLLEGGGPDGELGEEGVVVRGDGGAHHHRRVHAHAHAPRGAIHLQAAHVGLEVHRGVLGGDTRLNRHAVALDVLLAGDAQVRQGGPRRDAQLALHDVDARHLLRHRVLHLHTRVHLDEVVVAFVVHKKLYGTSVLVVDVLAQLDGIGEYSLASSLGQVHCRGHLHHLLVTALHGAVALVQMHDAAVAVSQDLHLNVAGLLDEALDEYAPVSEGGGCLGGCAVEEVLQVRALAHDAHPAPATAHCSLENDREAELLHKLLSLLQILYSIVRTRDDGDFALDGDVARRRLVAHLLQGFGARPHEGNALLLALARKVRALRQKTVPGVDRLDAVLLGNAHYLVHRQVALHGGDVHAFANAVRLVRLVPMRLQAVGRREHRHGARPQLCACSENAHCDLSAVCTQHLPECLLITSRNAEGSTKALIFWVGVCALPELFHSISGHLQSLCEYALS
mmetsp:Transcript_42058/g.80439  ORF Transcript_42058/g.80439 Transcript_42058/m.80439 type:complete len:782 (-) Transcript_42058:261-2606(-)